MKALVSRVVGGPDSLVLEDLPSPEPKAGEVIVSVKACGINFPDVLIIEDKYQYKPERPFSPGSDIAGVVKSVGQGVTSLKVGDKVLGSLGWGGLTQEMAAEAGRLIKIPAAMPFDDAAAFVMTFGTSYHALKDRADVKPGQTMLVLGAAGGVGIAAVELGRAMGVRVIAACSTQEKVDLCIARGAAGGVVYGAGPLDPAAKKALASKFKEACGPSGAHVIYDAVGGDYAEPALRAIAWEGRYLVVGFAAGEIPKIPLNLILLKGCEVVGVFFGEWVARNRDLYNKEVGELLEMYAAGKVKPFISERFSLEQGGEAIRHLGSRKAMGKVVVNID